MSLTSYRAAPPRERSGRTLLVAGGDARRIFKNHAQGGPETELGRITASPPAGRAGCPCGMDITRTRTGLRLSQHGVVISELRLTPGPTHSIFDVLAALVAVLRPVGRTGMLGFAGGGMMAPLAALGWSTRWDAVDLDAGAYALFCEHCPAWKERVRWHHGDASDWLGHPGPDFALLLDDLSVPVEGDVFKPDLCWDSLPQRMRSRLLDDGVAIFNLMLSPGDRWSRALPKVAGGFAESRLVMLEDFENRVLISGHGLPSARELGRQLRAALRRIRSRQSERVRVRTLDVNSRRVGKEVGAGPIGPSGTAAPAGRRSQGNPRRSPAASVLRAGEGRGAGTADRSAAQVSPARRES